MGNEKNTSKWMKKQQFAILSIDAGYVKMQNG